MTALWQRLRSLLFGPPAPPLVGPPPESPGVAGQVPPTDAELGTEFDDLPPPPTLLSVLERFGRRFFLDAVVPVALFLVLDTVAGLVWAMGAGTVWAVALIVVRRRAGQTAGALIWLSLAYVVARGTAGIITGSDAVYFGPGIATNFVVAGVFVVSVALRRPAVGYIAPIFYPFPDFLRRHDAYRRAFSRLTLLWAALETFTGAVQVILLAATSTNTYLIVRSVVSWPLSVALFIYSLRYPRQAFAREPELAPWVEAAEANRKSREELAAGTADAIERH